MDLESRMQVITENAYDTLNANLWYKNITKMRTTGARREVIMWLLSTAMIRPQGKGGNIAFEDLIAQYTELEVEEAGDGLKLQKNQIEDTDGQGIELASQWSSDIGAYMSYWPQKQVSRFLKTADSVAKFPAYDKKAFFAKDHPVNPFNPAAGTYANLFTGAAANASGATPAYPGALPLDEDSVSLEQAFKNLTKLIAYYASIKMPNGEDPRGLRLNGILCSPRLFPRLVQLTSAKYIAVAIGNIGVGPQDVEALVKALGFATPIQCDELAGFEDDKSYFVSTTQITSNQLGGVIYSDRESFHIDYYGILDDAELGRKREFEWQCHGRNAVGAGHPYLLAKCLPT